MHGGRCCKGAKQEGGFHTYGDFRVVMVEFLQSIPTWVYGPVAVLVSAILTIATTLYVNRKRKRLWYGASTFPVVGERLSSRVQVSVGGEVLPDVYVCAVKLLYRGSEPLLETDFRTPINFEFEDTKVLDVEITETEPTGVKARVYTDKEHRFRLDPVALNHNTRLYARVLLTKPARLDVSSHIVGVKVQHESQRDKLRNALVYFWPVGIALSSVFLALEETPLWDGPADGVFTTVGLFVAYLTFATLLGHAAILIFRDR